MEERVSGSASERSADVAQHHPWAAEAGREEGPQGRSGVALPRRDQGLQRSAALRRRECGQ